MLGIFKRFRKDKPKTINPAAQKWVAALRSGKYKQGKHVLRSVTDRYCCLGVLCELAVEAGVIPPPELENGAYYRYGESRTALPPAVRDWAFLSGIVGLFNDKQRAGNNNSLVWLNDTEKLSFSEIADLIESNPKGLFIDDEAKRGAKQSS